MYPYTWLVFILSASMPWSVWFFGSANYYSDYIQTAFLPHDNQVYDFIVVGAGAAGSVVAKRLSTNKNVKVLLLEAGGDPSPFNHIPGIAIDLLGYKNTDWMFRTVPQKNACWGLENNQSSWNAGKVLGGSTTLNFLMYLRGHQKDYDSWAKATGDEEWSYKNVLPFFKKSIKSYHGGYSDNVEHYSESEYGFLNIEGRSWVALQKEFIDAGQANDFPYIDVNGGSQRSAFGVIETLQKDGYRFGTYASIILELEKRKNIKISRFSQAIKIKLDKNLVAEGVWYLHHGVKKFARARKEIILSAGSINSPKLLMLSGIGPENHLKSMKIKPKLNLPAVGENLQDHIFIPILPFKLNDSVSFVPDRDLSPSVFYDFFATGKGVLTVPNGIHSQIFYSTSAVQKTGEDWPNIQTFFAPAGVFSLMAHSSCRESKMRQEIIKKLVEPHMGSDGFLLLVGLVRPKSRGNVLLNSKDALEHPLIDPHYLEHPDDIKALVEGIQKMQETFENSKSFKKLGIHLPKEHILGCEAHAIHSKAYWECYARHLTLTIWHPSGTCRMGRGQDKASVVDTKLKVINTRHLRVIDNSIIPFIPNANTMAPALMIGEKGAHFIREEWAQHFLISDLKDHLLFKNSNKCYYSQLI